ncbi:hypothetical protein FHU30_006344 [Actinomadura rupiterrae]|nr:hypothetical protein [Actinomadura rupiterrae]
MKRLCAGDRWPSFVCGPTPAASTVTNVQRSVAELTTIGFLTVTTAIPRGEDEPFPWKAGPRAPPRRAAPLHVRPSELHGLGKCALPPHSCRQGTALAQDDTSGEEHDQRHGVSGRRLPSYNLLKGSPRAALTHSNAERDASALPCPGFLNSRRTAARHSDLTAVGRSTREQPRQGAPRPTDDRRFECPAPNVGERGAPVRPERAAAATGPLRGEAAACPDPTPRRRSLISACSLGSLGRDVPGATLISRPQDDAANPASRLRSTRRGESEAPADLSSCPHNGSGPETHGRANACGCAGRDRQSPLPSFFSFSAADAGGPSPAGRGARGSPRWPCQGAARRLDSAPANPVVFNATDRVGSRTQGRPGGRAGGARLPWQQADWIRLRTRRACPRRPCAQRQAADGLVHGAEARSARRGTHRLLQARVVRRLVHRPDVPSGLGCRIARADAAPAIGSDAGSPRRTQQRRLRWLSPQADEPAPTGTAGGRPGKAPQS